MRNTKVCPKCGSSDLVVVPGTIGGYGSGNNIPLKPSLWIFRAVKVTRYLCCGCGFSEEWIDDPQDREKIKKKYGVDG